MLVIRSFRNRRLNYLNQHYKQSRWHLNIQPSARDQIGQIYNFSSSRIVFLLSVASSDSTEERVDQEWDDDQNKVCGMLGRRWCRPVCHIKKRSRTTRTARKPNQYARIMCFVTRRVTLLTEALRGKPFPLLLL